METRLTDTATVQGPAPLQRVQEHAVSREPSTTDAASFCKQMLAAREKQGDGKDNQVHGTKKTASEPASAPGSSKKAKRLQQGEATADPVEKQTNETAEAAVCVVANTAPVPDAGLPIVTPKSAAAAVFAVVPSKQVRTKTEAPGTQAKVASSDHLSAATPATEPAGEMKTSDGAGSGSLTDHSASMPVVENKTHLVETVVMPVVAERAHQTARVTASLDVQPAKQEPAIAAAQEGPAIFANGPNVLEVGIASNTHGWLRVRAEVSDTGAISAQVTAQNSAAAEHLHKELPAIQAFLAGEHIGLSDLHVRFAGAQSGAQDAMRGDAQGAGAQTSGQGMHQGSSDRRATASDGEFGMAEGENFGYMNAGPWSSVLPAGMLALQGAGQGSWLSVRV